MKKLILSLTLIAFISTAMHVSAAQVTNAEIRAAVQKYKMKNYIGCLQDTQAMVKKDPSSAIAYYYQALAYSQLGKRTEATDAYNSVITLNSMPILVENATKAINCLEGKEGCKPEEKEESELDTFVKSGKFYGNSVQSELNQKRLEHVKQEINNQKSEMPTNDEIAEAVKTLAKAGINPLAGMNGANPTAYANMFQQSPEMMQMNMLMGGNNNNSMGNNMMPMLMMAQQNGQKVSPELIQSMMMSNMASDFNYGSQTY